VEILSFLIDVMAHICVLLLFFVSILALCIFIKSLFCQFIGSVCVKKDIEKLKKGE
jgi:uncharacterized membrane protein